MRIRSNNVDEMFDFVSADVVKIAQAGVRFIGKPADPAASRRCEFQESIVLN